jgi:hypothetical protein
MRDFFINAFEKLVGVVIVLLLIGVVSARALSASHRRSRVSPRVSCQPSAS